MEEKERERDFDPGVVLATHNLNRHQIVAGKLSDLMVHEID